MIAVQKKFIAGIKGFLQHGASLSLKNKEGLMAWQLGMWQGVELLRPSPDITPKKNSRHAKRKPPKISASPPIQGTGYVQPTRNFRSTLHGRLSYSIFLNICQMISSRRRMNGKTSKMSGKMLKATSNKFPDFYRIPTMSANCTLSLLQRQTNCEGWNFL